MVINGGNYFYLLDLMWMVEELIVVINFYWVVEDVYEIGVWW